MSVKAKAWGDGALILSGSPCKSNLTGEKQNGDLKGHEYLNTLGGAS